MKKTVIRTVTLCVLFLTSSAEAFEIRTGLMSLSGVEGQYSNPPKYLHDSNNVLFEIGGYTNNDHEGFSFGWRVGGSYALKDGNNYRSSSAETGLSIGYTLVRDLDIKGELGLGWNTVSDRYTALSTYIGLGVDYAIGGHYIFGVAVRKFNGFADTDSPASNGYVYAPVAGILNIGYRF